MGQKAVCVIWFLLSLPLLILVPLFGNSQAEPFRVLVVMSYEENFPWVSQLKNGIEKELSGACDIRYFYMDTKRNLDGGPRKAKQAYDLFRKYKPDGVIVADDNGQAMFVVPYLKDKVNTPVMFCGVNEEAEKYGYPASNVSGILERIHFKESISFAKQLSPNINTFGFIIKDSPTGRALLEQIQKGAEDYEVRLVAFRMAKTLEQAQDMTNELKDKCDLLYISAMAGILDVKGNPIPEKEAVQMVLKAWGARPSVATEEYNVKNGALCTVVRTGEEQGSTAAKMLLQAMQGKPVAQIPIVQNRYGKRVINVTTMKELGIKPKPVLLLGTELVRSEE